MIHTHTTRSVTAWLGSALFVIAAALTQPPVSAQPAQPPTQSNDSATPDGMAVTGCLVRLDTSAWRPGTSDAIPAGHRGQPVSSGYALKEAVESTGAEPATGPVATRSDREFGIAKGDVSVGGFAGHQVVINGRLTSIVPGSAAAADRTHLPPGHNAMIDVTAIRSISASCPPRG